MPPGFENAPEWVQNLFYGIMAIGAAYFALRKITAGMKDESRIVRVTGRASTVEEVIDAPEPRARVPANIGGPEHMRLLGGGIIERQIAEDHLILGRAIVTRLEGMEKALTAVAVNLGAAGDLHASLDRLSDLQERRLEMEAEEDRKASVREEAEKLFRDHVRDHGIVLNDRGSVPLEPRAAQPRPRRGP